MQKATEINKEDKDKLEAMLYSIADKFLDTVDLEKLKEISMTRLGQMIWEDGIAEGKVTAYLEMIRDGFITKEESAIRLKMPLEELNILLNDEVSV